MEKIILPHDTKISFVTEINEIKQKTLTLVISDNDGIKANFEDGFCHHLFCNFNCANAAINKYHDLMHFGSSHDEAVQIIFDMIEIAAPEDKSKTFLESIKCKPVYTK